MKLVIAVLLLVPVARADDDLRAQARADHRQVVQYVAYLHRLPLGLAVGGRAPLGQTRHGGYDDRLVLRLDRLGGGFGVGGGLRIGLRENGLPEFVADLPRLTGFATPFFSQILAHSMPFVPVYSTLTLL